MSEHLDPSRHPLHQEFDRHISKKKPPRPKRTIGGTTNLQKFPGGTPPSRHVDRAPSLPKLKRSRATGAGRPPKM